MNIIEHDSTHFNRFPYLVKVSDFLSFPYVSSYAYIHWVYQLSLGFIMNIIEHVSTHFNRFPYLVKVSDFLSFPYV